jgi:hypothetical protein
MNASVQVFRVGHCQRIHSRDAAADQNRRIGRGHAHTGDQRGFVLPPFDVSRRQIVTLQTLTGLGRIQLQELPDRDDANVPQTSHGIRVEDFQDIHGGSRSQNGALRFNIDGESGRWLMHRAW